MRAQTWRQNTRGWSNVQTWNLYCRQIVTWDHHNSLRHYYSPRANKRCQIWTQKSGFIFCCCLQFLATSYLLVGFEMFALLYISESMPGVISICVFIVIIMKCEDKVLSVHFQYPGGSSRQQADNQILLCLIVWWIGLNISLWFCLWFEVIRIKNSAWGWILCDHKIFMSKPFMHCWM